MSILKLIEERLQQTLAPSQLEVIDDSHLHEGHEAYRVDEVTHVRVRIGSAAFAGQSRVQCHRMVNDAVREAFTRGLHALAIEILAA